MRKVDKEKRLEKALKEYRESCAKRDPEWARKEAEGAKMLDEEVAAEVAKAIWETAHLVPREQAEKLPYMFWWISIADPWPVSDIASRLIHDEEEAKHLLCERFVLPHFGRDDDNGDILATAIREGKFIHFQMTAAFNGGMDAYIVFRTPKTRRAVVIRFCR